MGGRHGRRFLEKVADFAEAATEREREELREMKERREARRINNAQQNNNLQQNDAQQGWSRSRPHTADSR